MRTILERNWNPAGSGVKSPTEIAAQVARLFFGRLDDGRLQVGVVDQDSGYIAGQFDQGRVRSSDERQTLINAFRVAEQAAKAAAERYAGQGNTASARFYQDKARALREQMD